MIAKSKLLCALLAGLALALPASRADAGYFSLSVGIDDYGSGGLEGAVNDAKALSAALKAIGAQTEVLIDHQASRQAVLDGLEALLQRAKPGDTVIFTYAGHGSQAKERVSGSEADGHDEVYILPGGGPPLLDDDLAGWWDRAIKQGLKVVLVLDSCHSASAFRGVDARAPVGKARNGGFLSSDVAADVGFPSQAAPDTDLPPGVFSFAGADDARKLNEIRHQQAARGALSVAFAEALAGGADRDGNQWLSHTELTVFLRQRVRELTDNRQDPVIFSGSPEEPALLPTRSASPPPAPKIDAAPLKLAVLGGALPPALQGVQITQPDLADLVWDVAGGAVIAFGGDLIATGITADLLPQIIAKHRAVRHLQQQPAAGVLPITTLSANAAYRAGEAVGIEVGPVGGDSLVIFNLAQNGQVQFLYPTLASDAHQVQGTLSMPQFTTATLPYGVDYMVAAASPASSDTVVALLKSLHDTQSAMQAVQATTDWVRANKGRMGLQIIVTQER